MSARRILAAALVAVALCPSAYAQKVEFTPFYGYAFSGELTDANTGQEFEIDESACYGGMLDLPLSDTELLGFFYSRQETELKSDDSLFGKRTLFDLDVDYYHLGGTLIIPNPPWEPFVTGTLGVTHLSPDASGTDSVTRFSLGLGGGVRYFPTEHLGLYLGVRGFLTFMEGDTLFRSESGAATVVVDADGLWQVQLQAGLVFAF